MGKCDEIDISIDQSGGPCISDMIVESAEFNLNTNIHTHTHTHTHVGWLVRYRPLFETDRPTNQPTNQPTKTKTKTKTKTTEISMNSPLDYTLHPGSAHLLECTPLEEE